MQVAHPTMSFAPRRPPRFAIVLCFVAAILAACARPSRAQVDSPSAREARALIREVRQMSGSNWQSPSGLPQLEDVEHELQAGDRAEVDVLRSAADRLRQTSALNLDSKTLERLATALSNRTDELTPIAVGDWPAACRAEAVNASLAAPEQLAQIRQTFHERLAALDRVLSALDKQEAGWRTFLEWPQTTGLAASNSPPAELLDRLETRWHNAAFVWSSHELVEASLAVRAYIRQVRGELALETPEKRAVVWNELADLLAAGETAGEQNRPRIAELVANREKLGQAPRLTGSIRRAWSQPNFVLTASAAWLQSQLAAQVDEPYEVDGIFAGTPSTGTGRLKGATSCEFLPSTTVGQWIMHFHGESRAATTGWGDRVQVQSHATTRLRCEKLFSLDARGLRSQPARVTANTTVSYDNISAQGGPLRRALATRQTYASQSWAEADSAAYARRSLAAQFNAQGDAMQTRFNGWYGADLCNRLIAADRLAPQIRVRSGPQAFEFDGWLESPDFLNSPPPNFGTGASVLLRCTPSALKELAVGALGKRELDGAQLSQALSDFLGKPSGMDRSDQDFRLTFASDPCEVSFAPGEIRVNFRIQSFTSGDVHYPALEVSALYGVESRDQGPVLVRQGALSTKPLVADEGNAQVVSGRQQLLLVGVRRKLGKVLAKELQWRPVALQDEGNAQPSLRVDRMLVDGGWLQIAFASESKPTRPVDNSTVTSNLTPRNP